MHLLVDSTDSVVELAIARRQHQRLLRRVERRVELVPTHQRFGAAVMSTGDVRVARQGVQKRVLGFIKEPSGPEGIARHCDRLGLVR